MKDTHPNIEKKFRELMMAKSGSERMMMGMSMFDDACSIATSAIQMAYPNISPAELRQQLFLRCYGHEFSKQKVSEILKRL